MKRLTLIAILCIGCGSGEPQSVFTSEPTLQYRIPTLLTTANGSAFVFTEERIGGREDWRNTRIAYRQVYPDMGPRRYVPLEEGYVWSDPQPVELSDGSVLLLLNRRDHKTGNKAQCERAAGNRSMQFVAPSILDTFVLDRDLSGEWGEVGDTMLAKVSPASGLRYGSTLYAVGYALGEEADCEKPLTHANDRSFVMRSTDAGDSWHLYLVAAAGTNEASATLTPSGGVVLSSRTYGPQKRTLHTEHTIEALPNVTPLCHGGLVNVGGRLLASFPHAQDRRNLVLYDVAARRIVSVVEPGRAGYSNLAQVGGGVGIAYEHGESISFQIVAP